MSDEKPKKLFAREIEVRSMPTEGFVEITFRDATGAKVAVLVSMPMAEQLRRMLWVAEI